MKGHKQILLGKYKEKMHLSIYLKVDSMVLTNVCAINLLY